VALLKLKTKTENFTVISTAFELFSAFVFAEPQKRKVEKYLVKVLESILQISQRYTMSSQKNSSESMFNETFDSDSWITKSNTM